MRTFSSSSREKVLKLDDRLADEGERLLELDENLPILEDRLLELEEKVPFLDEILSKLGIFVLNGDKKVLDPGGALPKRGRAVVKTDSRGVIVGCTVPFGSRTVAKAGTRVPMPGIVVPDRGLADASPGESPGDGGSQVPVLDVRARSPRMPSAHCHHILIVEDDPDTGHRLTESVRSIGMTSRLATTLEETDAAFAEEEFCCVLLDKQLPFSAGALALTSTGDLAQKRVRARDPRRNAADQHIFPILVITGAAVALAPTPQAAFISRNFRDGATAYIPKPFDVETVTSEILGALERAGRADHASCASLRPPASSSTEAPSAGAVAATDPLVVLELDGVRAGRRMTFLVNGKRRDLQDSPFATVFRLAAERARGSEGYLPAREVGVTRAPEIPSRIRAAIADAVPEGFSILQRSDAGLRLHPLVKVGSIAWEAFEKDANPVLQAIAVAERKRR